MMLNILLIAQDVVGGTAEQLSNAAETSQVSFFDLLLKGGYILFPIFILSFIAVFLIIQKALLFRQELRIDKSTIDIFYNYLRKGDIDAANMHLASHNTSYARIFRKVLGKLGKPIKEIEGAIESASNIEVAKVNKNLGYLGLIAGIAPMLGFVGTISGIIKIFYNISLTDNISIGVISGGLYEKMISSGTGLIVGIIAYTGYHILNLRLSKFISRIEEESFEFLDLLGS
jgi:biopolymer transport protein ExbB